MSITDGSREHFLNSIISPESSSSELLHVRPKSHSLSTTRNDSSGLTENRHQYQDGICFAQKKMCLELREISTVCRTR